MRKENCSVSEKITEKLCVCERDEGSDNYLNIADVMINDLVHSNLHNAINLHIVSGGINIGKLYV